MEPTIEWGDKQYRCNLKKHKQADVDTIHLQADQTVQAIDAIFLNVNE